MERFVMWKCSKIPKVLQRVCPKQTLSSPAALELCAWTCNSTHPFQPSTLNSQPSKIAPAATFCHLLPAIATGKIFYTKGLNLKNIHARLRFVRFHMLF